MLDEVEAPIEGALVSVDGIEAVALSDAAGHFEVQSDSAFADSTVVTASKDGFDAFGGVVTLSTGTANNSFVLDSVVAMALNDPWGYIEITVTPGGKSLVGDSALFSNDLMSSAVTKAYDCEIDISGKVYRKGRKKSALYIMLVVDASGSTNDSVGNKRVFDVEIDALKALIDNFNSGFFLD